MSILHAFTKISMLACLFTSLLLGADLTGRWSGKANLETQDGNRALALLFILTQDGRKLTGTAGPNAESQHEISGGVIEGARIGFQVAGGKFVFDLRFEGDELIGSVTVTEGSESATGKVHLVRLSQ